MVRSLVACLVLAGAVGAGARPSAVSKAAAPHVWVERAEEEVAFPSETDSNSPAFWNDEGDLVLFNSFGIPTLSVGPDLSKMTTVGPVGLSGAPGGGNWLESVIRAGDGTLYGYYHNEPPEVCLESPGLTAPRIGAMRSRDDGQTWQDLGIILTAEEGYERCDTANSYFAGGVGDFTAILDREQRDVYFFYSAYGASEGGQGVAVARLAWADRDRPAGRVFKHHDGLWSEPGRAGGNTPIYPATAPWEAESAESFWGPSVHWNSALQQYVMLLSYSIGPAFANLGVFIAYAPTLDDPRAWSEPQEIITGGLWYPQVLGLEPGTGTDAFAGSEAWLCVKGICSYRIHFEASEPAATSARAGVVVPASRSKAPRPAAVAPAGASRRRPSGIRNSPRG